jgi:RNA polymerase sigma-70 factor (ECF subfamily)
MTLNAKSLHGFSDEVRVMDPKSDPDDDILLIRRLKQGDQDAATAIYLRYAERLLQLAKSQTPDLLQSRIDPEEIVQSVFRTFFRRAADGQYVAPEGDELWKLFLVMALNKIRTRGAFHRAKKRDYRRTVQGLEPEDAANRDDTQEAYHVLRLSIEDFIEQYPDQHRDVVRLRIEGFEVNQIAEKLQRSKRTVERILQGFREQLMKSALIERI